MALPLIVAGAAMAAAGAYGAYKSGATKKSTYNTSGVNNQLAANQAYGQQMSDLAKQYMNRGGPQMGAFRPASAADMGPVHQYGGATINPAADAEGKGLQSALAGKLMGQVDGTGPSLAQEQLRQGLAANLRSQMAAAASSRGGAVNGALALRNLGDQGAASRQQMVGQAALARLQEQQEAMGQLGALSGQMRSQDFGAALAQAQLSQQAGLFNAGALNQSSLMGAGFNQQANMANSEMFNRMVLSKYQGDLSTMGMNDGMARALLGMRQGSMSEALGAQGDMMRAQYQAEEDTRKRNLGLWGGLMGAGGNMLSMGGSAYASKPSGASGMGGK